MRTLFLLFVSGFISLTLHGQTTDEKYLSLFKTEKDYQKFKKTVLSIRDTIIKTKSDHIYYNRYDNIAQEPVVGELKLDPSRAEALVYAIQNGKGLLEPFYHLVNDRGFDIVTPDWEMTELLHKKLSASLNLLPFTASKEFHTRFGALIQVNSKEVVQDCIVEDKNSYDFGFSFNMKNMPFSYKKQAGEYLYHDSDFYPLVLEYLEKSLKETIAFVVVPTANALEIAAEKDLDVYYASPELRSARIKHKDDYYSDVTSISKQEIEEEKRQFREEQRHLEFSSARSGSIMKLANQYELSLDNTEMFLDLYFMDRNYLKEMKQLGRKSKSVYSGSIRAIRLNDAGISKMIERDQEYRSQNAAYWKGGGIGLKDMGQTFGKSIKNGAKNLWDGSGEAPDPDLYFKLSKESYEKSVDEFLRVTTKAFETKYLRGEKQAYLLDACVKCLADFKIKSKLATGIKSKRLD